MADTHILNQITTSGYSESSDYYNPEAFSGLVLNRRSCRVFTDEKIPEEIVEKCLDLALLAPNSSNLQPWEFYWVRSKEKREKLNYYCLDQPAAVTAAEIIVAVSKPDNWRMNRELMLEAFRGQDDIEVPKAAIAYYDKIVPLVYKQGPLGIMGLIKRIYLSVVGLKKPIPRKPASNADMIAWAHKSTALACENLMLAFRSYGYDTCPMEGLDQKKVAGLLGLSGNSEVCMAISAGKRSQEGIYGPRIRFDRELFIKRV